MNETELKIRGYTVLRETLGMVEMEKFLALVQADPGDYTRWRKEQFHDMSGDEISRAAMKLRDGE